jgi:hypothetical protein
LKTVKLQKKEGSLHFWNMTAKNGLVPTAAVLSHYMTAFAASAVGTKDRQNEKSKT